MDGSRLRAARKACNLTVDGLGEALGVSGATVSRWEKGIHEPDDDKKNRLAVVLNTKVAYLIGETDDPDPNSAKIEAKPDFTNIPGAIYSKEWVRVPIMDIGACAGRGWSYDFAGVEIERYEELPKFMVGAVDDERPPFMLKINGDSMEEAGMPDGAYAIVNPAETVYSGDSALCQYGEFKDMAFKWVYFLPDGAIELRSATPGYPVIKYEKDSEAWEYAPLTIIGKVVGTWNRPKRG